MTRRWGDDHCTAQSRLLRESDSTAPHRFDSRQECGTREYQQFAQFYDALMGDGSSRSARILEAIDHFDVGATSLLELGCDTGSVLEGLVLMPRLVGLDASAEMLSDATVKVPSAELPTRRRDRLRPWDHVRRRGLRV